MSQYSDQFLSEAEIKAFDLEHRRKINFNIGKYDAAVSRGVSRFFDLENSRKKANIAKWRTIENLENTWLNLKLTLPVEGESNLG